MNLKSHIKWEALLLKSISTPNGIVANCCPRHLPTHSANVCLDSLSATNQCKTAADTFDFVRIFVHTAPSTALYPNNSKIKRKSFQNWSDKRNCNVYGHFWFCPFPFRSVRMIWLLACCYCVFADAREIQLLSMHWTTAIAYKCIDEHSIAFYSEP